MNEAGLEDLRLHLAAEKGSVAEARHAVADFADRVGADADAVAVAVSETVTNAVMHAYPKGDPGQVIVEAKRNGTHMIVLVSDGGHGIRPNPESPGLGYGLALVASLADEIAIADSPEGGTQVKMRFPLAAAA
jgi:anti-sigma regulatory factor (Ser/Thr protein kinase)